MKCPKCGHVQEQHDECEKCGIFIAKYLKKKADEGTLLNNQRAKKKSFSLFLAKDREMSLYYHTTYQMTDAGFPAKEVLQHFYKNIEKLTASEPFLRIEKVLENGEPASVGMKQSPEYFPRYHATLIEVGEKTGTPQVFYKMLDKLLTEKISIKGDILRAMTRPGLTITAAFFILPLPVLVSQGLLPYLMQSAVPFSVGLFLLFAALKFYSNQIASKPEGDLRAGFDALVFKLPVVQNFCVLQYIRALLAMNKAGVHVIDSFTLAAEAAGNRYFAEQIINLEPSLKAGNTLSNTLRKSHVMPQDFLTFIATGESTGKLDESLQRLLFMQEEQFRHQLRAFCKAATTGVIIVTMTVVAVEIVAGFQKVLL